MGLSHLFSGQRPLSSDSLQRQPAYADKTYSSKGLRRGVGIWPLSAHCMCAWVCKPFALYPCSLLLHLAYFCLLLHACTYAHAPLDRHARATALGLKPPPADASTDAEPSDPEKPSASEQASKHDSRADKHEHDRQARARAPRETETCLRVLRESASHHEPKRETLTW